MSVANPERTLMLEEISADQHTPAALFQRFRKKGSPAILLESALRTEDVGRYTILAFDPHRIETSVEGCRRALKEHPQGVYGYLSYDGEYYFMFPRLVFLFDHFAGKLNISLSGGDQEEFEAILKKMKEPVDFGKVKGMGVFEPDIDDQTFCSRVLQAKEAIMDGEVFQLVLSRSFTKKYEGDPFEVYRALRMTNPAPFMFYIETEEFAAAGSSPERLIKVDNGKVETMPIAGTRPSSGSVEELLNDPKEVAEHMMLVDLARNDIGSVSKIGTVQVKKLKEVRHFANVMHLVSVVSGELKDGVDAFDALEAAFPAGTLSGAPKIRAMELIKQMENSKRGLYGGVICALDGRGNLESCIAIRMVTMERGVATVRAGAGIVYDSVPQMEADETRHKGSAVMEAVK